MGFGGAGHETAAPADPNDDAEADADREVEGDPDPDAAALGLAVAGTDDGAALEPHAATTRTAATTSPSRNIARSCISVPSSPGACRRHGTRRDKGGAARQSPVSVDGARAASCATRLGNADSSAAP